MRSVLSAGGLALVLRACRVGRSSRRLIQCPACGAASSKAPGSPGRADLARYRRRSLEACRLFAAALDLAASNYEEFAYATAGDGNSVDYQDPGISQYNVLGRTALRQAAARDTGCLRTPGLPADVADPMRSWSLHATKLILIMGLRGGGDSLNSAATDLNTDATNAQMACSLNGGRA